jgi:hypothetical protein
VLNCSGGGGGTRARSIYVFRKLIAVFVAVRGSSIKTCAVALAIFLKYFVESVSQKEMIFGILDHD